METRTFQAVVVTAETLQILSKQNKYPELLALYMAYVEITTWQANNSVKATTDFMSKRLKWSDKKIQSLKKTLINLTLIEDVVRKDDKGKITGYYILVKHVTNPPSGFDHPLDSSPTNANDFQLSAKDTKFTPEMIEQIEKIYDVWLKLMVVDPAIRAHGTTDERRDALTKARNRTRLTDKRKAHIAARLRTFGPITEGARHPVLSAIINISKSDFHRGENDSNWSASLEWLCKNDEKIEEWANKGGKE
jgi:hypothetical protein